jgi:prepilin-type N-terminal cleavage/methylation domain-containing protein
MRKALLSFFNTCLNQAGFTMIELLVVISVIGVLAVAVLSSINPIEQINKGRDTRLRTDAANLINAVDRYFAIHEEYPWNTSVVGGYTATVATYDLAFSFVGSAPDAAEWDWIDVLSSTDEVKQGYVNRLKADNQIVVFKPGLGNATMYACFKPSSKAFQQEAANNCEDNTTPDGIAPITTCVDRTGVINVDNYICLP